MKTLHLIYLLILPAMVPSLLALLGIIKLTDAASIAVAIGTLVLALVTVLEGEKSRKHLIELQADELIPDIFIKDVIALLGVGDKKVVTLTTKGITNLGTRSIVIHAVFIRDAKNKVLASGYPNIPFTPGYSLVFDEQGSAYPTYKDSGIVLTALQLPHIEVELRELVSDASTLVFAFRVGGSSTSYWEHSLPKLMGQGGIIHFDHTRSTQEKVDRSKYQR